MDAWNAAAYRIALDPEAVRRVEAIERAPLTGRASLARDLVSWVEGEQTRKDFGFGDGVRLGARLHGRGADSPLAESSAMQSEIQAWVTVLLGEWRFSVGVAEVPPLAGDPPSVPSQGDQPRKSPLPPARLREIQSNSEFTEALAVLVAQQEQVDWKRAYLLTSEAPSAGHEAVFPVVSLRSGKPGEWTKLVYTTPSAGPPVVFFDERNPSPEPPAPEPGAGGGSGKGGEPQPQGLCLDPWSGWSAWSPVGQPYCGPRFICLGNGSEGMFQDAKRSRMCPSGLKTQTRKQFLHCGGCWTTAWDSGELQEQLGDKKLVMRVWYMYRPLAGGSYECVVRTWVKSLDKVLGNNWTQVKKLYSLNFDVALTIGSQNYSSVGTKNLQGLGYYIHDIVHQTVTQLPTFQHHKVTWVRSGGPSGISRTWQ